MKYFWRCTYLPALRIPLTSHRSDPRWGSSWNDVVWMSAACAESDVKTHPHMSHQLCPNKPGVQSAQKTRRRMCQRRTCGSFISIQTGTLPTSCFPSLCHGDRFKELMLPRESQPLPSASVCLKVPIRWNQWSVKNIDGKMEEVLSESRRTEKKVSGVQQKSAAAGTCQPFTIENLGLTSSFTDPFKTYCHTCRGQTEPHSFHSLQIHHCRCDL